MEEKIRCSWVPEDNLEYKNYHDLEWGVPVYEDKKLFEFLILEGAQAGLSWATVLKKQDGYRSAFFDFDVQKCAQMSDSYLDSLMQNPEIIRNRLKIYSVRKNALAFIEIQNEFGSFSDYIWRFVSGKPKVNNLKSLEEIPVKSDISDKISKDLKKRGMSFVGSTIIYSYMQAMGLINDHLVSCFRYKECLELHKN